MNRYFNFPIWPDQASEFAKEIDSIIFVLIGLTFLFTGIVATMIIFFAIRYRRGQKVDRSNPVHHSNVLELTWSIIPLVLGLAIFAWSVVPYVKVYSVPKVADEVYVVGKQWMWHLQHADTGIRENNELHLPIGRTAKFTIISQDVIHGFYIPAMRVKRDALPGSYNTCWITPNKAGKYHLFCTEYCGANHSEMGGWVYIMEPADYAKWQKDGWRKPTDPQNVVAKSPEQQGEDIFLRKNCGNCHKEENSSRAPSLYALYGKQRELLDGRKLEADRAYIRQAIVNPENNLLKGYGSITRMPNYSKDLTEDDINQLIAYIKTLGGSPKSTTVAANLTPVPVAKSGARR